jgi:hypothetical protein
MTTMARRLGTLAVYVLVALAAVGVPLEASQPLHVHHGDSGGLYNGECALAALTAAPHSAPTPAVPSAISTEAAPAFLAAAPSVRVATAPARHADPRAPPLG